LGVIPIGLVGAHLQCGMRVTSVQADDGQSAVAQFVPQPHRQRPGLQPHARQLMAAFAQDQCDRVGACGDLLLADHPAPLVDHADRGGFQRDIECGIVWHGGSLLRLLSGSSLSMVGVGNCHCKREGRAPRLR
jgi:hypothetical protein